MSAIPTVTIWKGGKHCIINACELDAWKAAGWSEQEAVPAPVVPDGDEGKTKRKQKAKS